MLLSLPVIAPEVPAVIEFSPAGERHLRLVLAMSRMGMILDEDLAGLRRTRMSANAIRVLIEKGWQRAVRGDYEYKLLSAYARLILPSEDDAQEFISEDGTPLVGVAVNNNIELTHQGRPHQHKIDPHVWLPHLSGWVVLTFLLLPATTGQSPIR